MKNHREHRVRYLFEYYGPEYEFISFLYSTLAIRSQPGSFVKGVSAFLTRTDKDP